MSIYKRLWIGLAALMLTVFCVTFILFGMAASSSSEDQLAIETDKNANTLALLLSQTVLDPVDLELTLSTTVNLSEFEYVRIVDAAGDTVFERSNPIPSYNSPQWFRTLFSVDNAPSSALVQQGWQTWSLELKSFDGATYDELWRVAVNNVLAMLGAFIVAGIIGNLALKRLLRSLTDVVNQARAIGDRRFYSIDVPATLEFAEVAESMNELSSRVKGMLEREASKLNKQREHTDIEPITGLLNRDTFVSRLSAKLDAEGEESAGSLGLIRIQNLADLNRNFGRRVIDELLKSIGEAVSGLQSDEYYGQYCSIGRLNGSDVCAFATNETNGKNLADLLQRLTQNTLREHGLIETSDVAAACIDFEMGDATGELLSALDGALAMSEQQAGNPIVMGMRTNQSSSTIKDQARYWSDELELILEPGKLELALFPVANEAGGLIHNEGMARLRAGETLHTAGEFMPWVFRLGKGKEFDKAVMAAALDEIDQTQKRTHINLSSESLGNQPLANWLNVELENRATDGRLLGVEVPESAVLANPEGFTALVRNLRPMGVEVGIEHVGFQVSVISQLADLGASYLKIDGMFSADVEANLGNRAALRTFVNVSQSLGIECIAEGVSTEKDIAELFELGLSGVCGRAVQLNEA